MSYSIVKANAKDAEYILDNCYPEEKAIHKKYCPWTDFKASNLASIKADEHCYIFKNPKGRPLVLFGIKPGEFNVVWFSPIKDMSKIDSVAFLRRGRSVAKEWHEQFGLLYGPVHEGWDALGRLHKFMGFNVIEDENIAYYGDIT